MRKYLKKQKRLKELLPLFTERPNVTLESILNDKDITRFPWENLQIREQIGVGSVGLVSKGILFMFVDFDFFYPLKIQLIFHIEIVEKFLLLLKNY